MSIERKPAASATQTTSHHRDRFFCGGAGPPTRHFPEEARLQSDIARIFDGRAFDAGRELSGRRSSCSAGRVRAARNCNDAVGRWVIRSATRGCRNGSRRAIAAEHAAGNPGAHVSPCGSGRYPPSRRPVQEARWRRRPQAADSCYDLGRRQSRRGDGRAVPCGLRVEGGDSHQGGERDAVLAAVGSRLGSPEPARMGQPPRRDARGRTGGVGHSPFSEEHDRSAPFSGLRCCVGAPRRPLDAPDALRISNFQFPIDAEQARSAPFRRLRWCVGAVPGRLFVPPTHCAFPISNFKLS